LTFLPKLIEDCKLEEEFFSSVKFLKLKKSLNDAQPSLYDNWDSLRATLEDNEEEGVETTFIDDLLDRLSYLLGPMLSHYEIKENLQICKSKSDFITCKLAVEGPICIPVGFSTTSLNEAVEMILPHLKSYASKYPTSYQSFGIATTTSLWIMVSYIPDKKVNLSFSKTHYLDLKKPSYSDFETLSLRLCTILDLGIQHPHNFNYQKPKRVRPSKEQRQQEKKQFHEAWVSHLDKEEELMAKSEDKDLLKFEDLFKGIKKRHL